MNHADVKKHLADYLEGDLELEARALVDAHLDHCDPCSMEVEEMLRTIRLLRTLPEPEIPPMIAANVMRRIRAGESRPGLFERVRRAVVSVLEPTFVLPASAIAVAALVVAVTQGTFTQGTFTQGIVTRGNPSEVVGLRSAFTGGEASDRAARYQPDRTRVPLTQASLAQSPLSQRPRTQAPLTQAPLTQPSSTSATASQGVAPRFYSSVPSTIRLRVDGSGVARLSMSRRSPSRRSAGASSSAGGPVFTSALPEAWAAEFSRVMYGEHGRSAGGVLVAADHSVRVSDGLVQSVARSRAVSQDQIVADLESDGADPRDAWLALGFEDPAGFARYIASQNLAEQELWSARLSERAEARGLLVEFLQALRESGDATARWVAEDFAAQASTHSDRDSSGGSEESLLR